MRDGTQYWLSHLASLELRNSRRRSNSLKRAGGDCDRRRLPLPSVCSTKPVSFLFELTIKFLARSATDLPRLGWGSSPAAARMILHRCHTAAESSCRLSPDFSRHSCQVGLTSHPNLPRLLPTAFELGSQAGLRRRTARVGAVFSSSLESCGCRGERRFGEGESREWSR